MQEIIDIVQDELLVHAYRRQGAVWTFDSIGGGEAELALPSVGVTVLLAAMYERVLSEGE